MLLACAQKLSKYLQEKDPNLRYLALDTMSRLAYTKIVNNIFFFFLKFF
jgi:vesicle coat complex subunit